ncbi:MAG: hypothetical protein FWF68_01235 [Spirochaetes bacterium]|nr:hypothetical protein [Spirochaetota bacterium]
MTESANLEILSTRNGFNSAVRHIKRTMDIASKSNANLGDIVYELDDEDLTSGQIGLLLRMLLVDKLGYKSSSTNLSSAVNDLSGLAKEFGKWNGVDLVAAYFHPEMGLLIANPKIAEELASFGQLRQHELMVVYAGLQGKETDEKCQKAADLALKVFEGSKITPPTFLAKGKYTVKKVSKPKKVSEKTVATVAKEVKAKASKGKSSAKRASAASTAAPVKKSVTIVQKSSGGPARMTPRYAVIVQNELFHNGNVEAWKRIIASYNAKHPNLEVFIYYENERILDINSLFKWGKVKHGSAIEFAVAGNDIQDVAKLQRYLAQGASHQFEAFLRGPVNTVLKLF